MRSLKLYEQLPRAIVQDTEGLDTDHNCTRCKLGEQPKLRTRCVAPEGEQGGLLIVGESPGKDEDMAGRPFIGISGKYLRSALAKHWSGPIAISNSLGCSPGADIDKSKLEKSVEACRPYLAQTIREVAPKRIVAVGAWAAFSIFGRSVPMFTMRRSYSYLYEGGISIPAMFVLHPAAALRNRFVKSWFDKDIEWALTATPPEPPINSIAHLVDNEQDALEAVRELEKAPRTSFDIEAAGIMFDPSYRVLCCSCSPLAADGSPTDTVFTWTKEGLADLKARAVLAKWLNSAKHVKIGHNLKYDSNGVRSGLGITLRGIGADTRLARKLLEPESDGSLDKCSELVGMGGFKEESITANHDALAPLKQSLGAEKRVAKYDAWAANPIGKAPPKPSKTTRSATQYIQDLTYRDPLLVGVIRADPSESGRYMFALLPDDILYRRNALDTIATARLDHLLTGELKKEPQLQRIWDRIVMPASRAVEHVERWGVAVDKTAIQNFDAYLVMKQSSVRARFDAYGKDFNPDSPQQVSELLFTKLGLPSIKQTPAEEESTDKSVLDALSGKHPIVDDLIEWRHLATLKKSYAGGMISYIRPDGRIHASILLDGARCLPAGELVLTSRGYLAVECVCVGDLVITHEGRTRSVLAVLANAPSMIYRAQLSNGLELRTTAEHEYLTNRGWVLAKDLVLTDTVIVHSDKEFWKGVDGWPYLVSSWGRVAHERFPDRPLMPIAKYKGTGQGHHKVTLVRGDRKRTSGNRTDFGVHRLVLNAFAAPSDLPEARHLNGVAWDNTIGNLVWGTSKDNRSDARKHGSMLRKAGCTVTPEQIEWICSLPKVHSKQARGELTDSGIALKLGISREHVRDIRSGKKRTDRRTDEEIERRVTFKHARVEAVTLEPAEISYGLVIEEDHSHVTGGIVTHNSGRTSIQNPALQTIPRAKDSPEGKMIRDCFIAAPGCLLIEADYGQAELRAAAMLSGDEVMAEIFRSGVDFHRRTAELVARSSWGIDPSAVEDKHRSIAKQLVFGLAYGMGDRELARRCKCTVQQAAKIREAVLGKFQKFSKWLDQQLAFARKHGCVWTWWDGQPARRRPLYQIADQDDARRILAEHGSGNTPIQGTASEFLIASLIEVVEWITGDGIEADVKLCLPVHDSLVLEVRKNMVDEVAAQLRSVMLGHNSLNVPFEIDLKVGPSWGSMEPYKLSA